jgi:hypothetical protein
MISIVGHYRVAAGKSIHMADAFNDRAFDLQPLFYNIFLFIKTQPRTLEEIYSFASQYHTSRERVDEFLLLLSNNHISVES